MSLQQSGGPRTLDRQNSRSREEGSGGNESCLPCSGGAWLVFIERQRSKAESEEFILLVLLFQVGGKKKREKRIRGIWVPESSGNLVASRGRDSPRRWRPREAWGSAPSSGSGDRMYPPSDTDTSDGLLFRSVFGKGDGVR